MGQTESYVTHHMRRLGCTRIEEKHYTVNRQRFEKGSRRPLNVGAMLTYGGCIVLIKHHPSTGWDTRWYTPGGGIEDGETPEEALEREVMEELSLRCRVLRLQKVNREVIHYQDRRADTYFFQFHAEVAGAFRPVPAEGEVMEVRLFDSLPENMAFREDYEGFFEEFKRGGATEI